MSDLIQVSNFIVLRGDTDIRIGDGNELWRTTFTIPQHTTASGFNFGQSYLQFMIRGLTYGRSSDIRINNVVVGTIARASDVDASHWFTQMATIASLAPGEPGYPIPLRVGQNELEIRAVRLPEPSASNVYDDFHLRNVILHYNYWAEI